MNIKTIIIRLLSALLSNNNTFLAFKKMFAEKLDCSIKNQILACCYRNLIYNQVASSFIGFQTNKKLIAFNIWETKQKKTLYAISQIPQTTKEVTG